MPSEARDYLKKVQKLIKNKEWRPLKVRNGVNIGALDPRP
jgi:hypothetical protein